MESRISIITLGVSDLDRSIRFYRDGLGFETNAKEGDQIAFFGLNGTALALYPIDKLTEDIGSEIRRSASGFSGVTIAHNVREKSEVSEILSLAEKSGGSIVKQAQDVFWGGHSGYFKVSRRALLGSRMGSK
ncbi:catechol 2,3-dioxygenase-like lactoylglutathione lyase family enzyme [Puniceicoccus vermicola]|nr:VOC family protein [Puniceicoccus vermicola]